MHPPLWRELCSLLTGPLARLPRLWSWIPTSQLRAPHWGRTLKEEAWPAPDLALLGCKMGEIMETSSYGVCLWLHVAMETERGSFMVNDLALAFIYALSYCAQVIYNPMEGSPSRGPMFHGKKERKSAPKKREGEKERKTKWNKNKWIKSSENCRPNELLRYLGLCVLPCIRSQSQY